MKHTNGQKFVFLHPVSLSTINVALSMLDHTLISIVLADKNPKDIFMPPNTYKSHQHWWFWRGLPSHICDGKVYFHGFLLLLRPYIF